MLPVFAEQPGFIRCGLIECGNQAVSISIWETEAEADAANAVAAAWVRDTIAQNVRLETTYVGDLAFFSSAPALVSTAAKAGAGETRPRRKARAARQAAW